MTISEKTVLYVFLSLNLCKKYMFKKKRSDGLIRIVMVNIIGLPSLFSVHTTSVESRGRDWGKLLSLTSLVLLQGPHQPLSSGWSHTFPGPLIFSGSKAGGCSGRPPTPHHQLCSHPISGTRWYSSGCSSLIALPEVKQNGKYLRFLSKECYLF